MNAEGPVSEVVGEQMGITTAALNDLYRGFLELLPGILVGLVVLGLFYLLSGVTRRVILRATNRSGYGQALGRLARLGVLLGGLLIGMAVAFPTVNGSSLLGALGVSGVAIGFAFRDILQNYFAGILLLWREPFRVGDQIITSSSFEGTVESIETRATFIRTYDGRRVVIPNANLFIDSVTVNTAFEHRRLEYDLGVGYGDDIEQAQQLILAVLKDTQGVLKEPAPDVLVTGFADSSVTLRVRWWARPKRAEVLEAQDKVLRAIKKTFDHHGIDLPYPTQQLLFHDQTEETDGDRQRQREGWPAGRGEVPKPEAPKPRARDTSRDKRTHA